MRTTTDDSTINAIRYTTGTKRIARLVLVAFVITFICARVLVLLIMMQKVPDLFLHVGGTHVHHLNYGIFLLSLVGAYLLFIRPNEKSLEIVACVYGVGLALTFDEFGMWLHLGGSYWQRASYDAIVVITSILLLIGYCSLALLKRLTTWWIATTVLALTIGFFMLLNQSLRYVEKNVVPSLHRIERNGPQ